MVRWIALLLLLAACGGANAPANDPAAPATPEATVNALFKTFEARDSSGWPALFVPEDRELVEGKANAYRENPGTARLLSATILATRVSGDRAEVDVRTVEDIQVTDMEIDPRTGKETPKETRREERTTEKTVVLYLRQGKWLISWPETFEPRRD